MQEIILIICLFYIVLYFKINSFHAKVLKTD